MCTWIEPDYLNSAMGGVLGLHGTRIVVVYHTYREIAGQKRTTSYTQGARHLTSTGTMQQAYLLSG